MTARLVAGVSIEGWSGLSSGDEREEGLLDRWRADLVFLDELRDMTGITTWTSVFGLVATVMVSSCSSAESWSESGIECFSVAAEERLSSRALDSDGAAGRADGLSAVEKK